MKTFLFTLIFNSLAALLPAQAPTLTIFPDPAEKPPFPNTELTYYIFPWSPDCHHLDTVIGGEVISQGFYDGKLKIIIVWQKPVDSMPVLIAVRRAGNNCDFLPPDRVGVVPVITPLNTVPVVTGINEYYLGEYGSTTLTASFDPLGDGVSIATNFEWEVPAEWNFFPYGPGLSNVSLYFTPQTYLTESCVRVRGQFLEGGWSEWTDYSPIGQVQIFNHLGQWIATWDDPPSKRVVKSVADLPNGLYTLRAMIRGRVITKPLAIVRLY